MKKIFKKDLDRMEEKTYLCNPETTNTKQVLQVKKLDVTKGLMARNHDIIKFEPKANSQKLTAAQLSSLKDWNNSTISY
jgi:hypothetical protein